jgi:hypothetical protein
MSSRIARDSPGYLEFIDQLDDRFRAAHAPGTDAASEDPRGLELDHASPECGRRHRRTTLFFRKIGLPESHLAESHTAACPGPVEGAEDPRFDLGPGERVGPQGRDRSGLGAEHLPAQQRHRAIGSGRLTTDPIDYPIDERCRWVPPEGPPGPVSDDRDELVAGVRFERQGLTARETVGGGAIPRPDRFRDAAQDEPDLEKALFAFREEPLGLQEGSEQVREVADPGSDVVEHDDDRPTVTA